MCDDADRRAPMWRLLIHGSHWELQRCDVESSGAGIAAYGPWREIAGGVGSAEELIRRLP
jgi:hypothetical protein